METNPTTEKKSSGIYSFKPRGEQLIFLEGLLKEKGSMTEALKHVVELAMTPSADLAIDMYLSQVEALKKEKAQLIEKHDNLVKEWHKLVADLKSEIAELKKKEVLGVDPAGSPGTTKPKSHIGMF